eukprot:CAMPEP_0167774564 /NCGR_PEP_ID=MMETSP0111_2-20121227/2072_1 /TAXON_ID=91324 /ORGANISM="Lotharella globosa, Strain CCCM811" /LENGTH=111 /DNA_ID=CAMNT_0007664379 /DNA_START=1601 /DNA_END=1936 /DNA_ORIENTATION=-
MLSPENLRRAFGNDQLELRRMHVVREHAHGEFHRNHTGLGFRIRSHSAYLSLEHGKGGEVHHLHFIARLKQMGLVQGAEMATQHLHQMRKMRDLYSKLPPVVLLIVLDYPG